MAKPIVFMLSGQGSHYFHMGRDLYEHEPIFKKWMVKIDRLVYEKTGQSVADYIYDPKRKKSDWFNALLYSHPAIFMVEYAVAQTLIEKGVIPDYLFGASLGEFTGVTLAGAITLDDALTIVIDQCQIFASTCQPGTMVAILDNPDDFNSDTILKDNSEMASINFNGHYVIATSLDQLDRIKNHLNRKNSNYQVLPVNFGFHSSLVEPAKSEMLTLIQSTDYKALEIPLVSCTTGKIESNIHKNHFWKVIRQPIQFQKTMHHLEGNGSYHYVDLGPSGTLATFVKYLLPPSSESTAQSVLPLMGKEVDSLNAVTQKLKKRHTKIKDKENGMLAYIFPGQGSQKKGMGNGLFDKFQDLTSKADAILGYPIKDLCLNNPDNNLGQTQYTQPALFTVNALMYYDEIEKTGKRPNYVAGHSLGEYNALLAAEVFDFETGLKLVQKRGALMSRAKGGGMAAIIGLNEHKIHDIIEKNSLTNLFVANYNTPSQIVIAGPKQDILDAKTQFTDGGAGMYIPLQVSGAFHTSFMETAIDEFSAYLNQFDFGAPKIPVISNLEARPYTEAKAKANLIKQIVNSVKWTESIRYLMGKGDIEFKEIGPGNVLIGLVNKIKAEAEPLVIDKPEEATAAPPPVQEVAPTNQTGNSGQPDLSHEGSGVLPTITMESLGSAAFKKEYNLKLAYLAGGMYKGIASKDLVVRMGNAGLMGFLGTGGMGIAWIEKTIQEIRNELKNGASFGMNLLNSPLEEETVDLYLRQGIKHIEAAAYLQMTPGLVRYRLKGLSKNPDGTIRIKNKILAKVSRPEVAEAFLSPAPDRIVKKLLEAGKITSEEAGLSKQVPMTDDICVEADSGGHTDQGVMSTLFPAMLILKREMKQKFGYTSEIRIGAAGGIGTPEAAASAFVLGADFILTGSINQCTVEAGTSDIVKTMLQSINVQDTDYAPAGDMFELGAKVQVLRKGVFFPARANKLYFLYQQYNSLDEIDEKTKTQLQEKYFKRRFDEIYEDCRAFYPENEITKAEQSPKYKMTLVLKWYFGYSTQLALSGNEKEKVNFQIHCGPALGAFNQWVKGTDFEDWRNRRVDLIAEKLMQETASLLNHRFQELSKSE